MKAIIYPYDSFRSLIPWTEFTGLWLDSPWTSIDTDVKESPFDYKLEMDIPEMRKKDLKISSDNQTITIEGKRKRTSRIFSKKGSKYVASFRKSFTLPEGVDSDRINAKFRDGMLSITLPKKEEFINYREIPVEGAGEVKILDCKDQYKRLNKTGSRIKRIFKKAA